MLEYIETTSLSGTTHKERSALYTIPTPQEYFSPFIMEFPLCYEDHAPLNDLLPSALSLSYDKPYDVCPPLDVCQIQDPILKPGLTPPESDLLTEACTTVPNLYELMPDSSCDGKLLCIQATSADYLEGLHWDGSLASVPLTSRQSNSQTCDNLASNPLLVETSEQKSDVDLHNAGCQLLECKGDNGFCLDRCEDPIEAFLSQSEHNFVGFCSDFDVSYFDLLETVAENRQIQTKTHEFTKCISQPPLKPCLRSSQSGLRLRSASRSVQGSQPKVQPSASSEKVIHFPKRTRRLHSGHLPPKKYFLKQYLFAQSLLELQ